MTKPRIAIPVPTSTDLAYNERSWRQYASCVESAGGEAVQILLSLTPAQVADQITSCQGVLLPGSPADVNPQKYGQDPVEACARPDAARENVDELLIQDAYNLHKPILGVCFGAQILNVWCGGTLVQDLTVMPINHPAGGSVAIAHSAAVAPDSLLSELLPQSEAPLKDAFFCLPVNSSHHQAIAIPGDTLRVVARSPQDGVIEAVEGEYTADSSNRHFVLGVQWHPERSYEISPSSKAIFGRLVHEAVIWKPRQVTTSVA